MIELSRMGVAICCMALFAFGCEGRGYSGLLGSDATILRQRAGDWKCAATTLNPTRVGSAPYQLCEGTLADTQVGVLSDRGGVVLEVARGWKPSRDPTAEFGRLRGLVARGREESWCDTLGVADSRVWVEDSTYTVLTLHRTPPSIALHRALGTPYCRSEQAGRKGE
jgi:hypothetical protein